MQQPIKPPGNKLWFWACSLHFTWLTRHLPGPPSFLWVVQTVKRFSRASLEIHSYMLQGVAGCCSVLQCVAVCGSVWQCVVVCCSVLQCVAVCCSMLTRYPHTPDGTFQRNPSPNTCPKCPPHEEQWISFFYLNQYVFFESVIVFCFQIHPLWSPRLKTNLFVVWNCDFFFGTSDCYFWNKECVWRRAQTAFCVWTSDATHCNTLQCTAALCNTLQHTATHCNTLQHTAAHCNTVQHTAAHCSTLQHTAIHCSTLQHTATRCNTLQHTATNCNTLQHSATNCNILKPIATRCSTLHHTATHCNRPLIHVWHDSPALTVSGFSVQGLGFRVWGLVFRV